MTSIGEWAFEDCSEKMCIFVEKDSYAENWAKERGYQVCYIEESLATTEQIAEQVPITGTTAQPVSSVTTQEQKTALVTETSEKPASVRMPQKISGFKALAKKKQLILKWKRMQNISGYEIQVSLKKTYKQPKIYRVKASKKTYTVKKLKPGKKYYVRIRAYRKDSASGVQMDVYGKWSALKVKTKK